MPGVRSVGDRAEPIEHRQAQVPVPAATVTRATTRGRTWPARALERGLLTGTGLVRPGRLAGEALRAGSDEELGAQGAGGAGGGVGRPPGRLAVRAAEAGGLRRRTARTAVGGRLATDTAAGAPRRDLGRARRRRPG